jgi:AcrR family transcriptional regulator
MFKMSTSTRPAYHHGNLRETLVALALAMLEQVEPEQLTLRGLAEEAGVSGMAPYRHFEDKAALLSAVAEAGFVELRRRLASVDDERKPRKALIAFAVAYIGFACDKPNLYRVMFGGAPPTPDDRLTADPRTVFGLFSTRLAQLVPPRRRAEAFLACWSLAHGLASLIVNGRIRAPADEPAKLAKRLAGVMLRGVLTSAVAEDGSPRRRRRR